jgi:hypothetical protein
MPVNTPERKEKTEKKTPVGFRLEPWLADELENFGRLHNLNRTDALHLEMMELLEFKRNFEANPWGTLGGYLKAHPKTFNETQYPIVNPP